MSPRPERMRLASGVEANVLVVRPKRAVVDRGFLSAPSEAEQRCAQILQEARIEAPLTPVPGPHHSLSTPEQIAHPDLGVLDVFSQRGKAALVAETYTQAPLFLLRGQASNLGAGTLVANSNYFLFGKEDFDAPWNAYGDPVGLVLSEGEVFYAPQLPRSCLLWSGNTGTVRPLAFDDVQITLPSGQAVRPHSFGAARETSPGMVFARYFGAQGGLSPEGRGYDIAYLGQHPAAGAPAGKLPIPRAGCVVRFEDRDAALASLGPLEFTLPGAWREGVQAGPQILRYGTLTDLGPDIFRHEHMTETDALPEPGSVSPARWKANWDETRAARLGAGVTEAGELVMVAVEGRSSHFSGQAAATGATLRDLALLMQDLGCNEALHLDGGGSTQVFGQAGGALIAPTDVHHGLMDHGARYDRPIPTWLKIEV